MAWAVVLGGSSGLGLASARRLAREGFKLCVVYREPRANQPLVQQAMLELEQQAPALLHFNADALTEVGRNLVLDTLEPQRDSDERVAVLLHSLAKGALKPLRSTHAPSAGHTDRSAHSAVAQYETEHASAAAYPRPELTALDVKLTIEAMGTSLLDWVTALRGRGLFAPDTRILAFTSEGSHRVWPGYGAVSAAKATLEALIRSIAYELGPLGIRANCIQAGVTDTRALRHIPNSELLLRQALARNPMGRLTTPEDVADVVALLCRPEARWINGTVVVADGGEHLC